MESRRYANPPVDGSATPTRTLGRAAAVLTLAVWAALAFGHPVGDRWANQAFVWARGPGALVPAGGAAGFARANQLLLAVAVGVASAGLAWLVRRVARRDRQTQWRAALPWAAWCVVALLAWRCYVVLATELIHFFQYALVAGLAAWALGRGRHPQAAFLLATGLGVADESWQHWGLHAGDPQHWLDWGDVVLNAVGAAAGGLAATTRARLRGEALAGSFHLVWRSVALGALLTGPLLLLDPATRARWLGPYPVYPAWREYDNAKPVHWPGPREGVAAVLASVVVLGSLVEPGRRALSAGGVLALGTLLLVAVEPQSRRQGQPVHLDVPTVRVPWSADPALVVDGRLDEPAWQTAAEVGPLVDSVTGGPCRRGATRVRLLWDDRALYLAFTVEDADVWVTDAGRDGYDPTYLEGLTVHLDEGSDEITYLSFDLVPSGVVSEQFSLIPGAAMDYNPDNRHIGLRAWDPPGIQAAVQVDGTLERVASWSSQLANDTDRGYTAELALPWSVFRTSSTPFVRSLPPRPGDTWRLELARVERPRVAAGAVLPGAPLTTAEVAARLGLSSAGVQALRATCGLYPVAEGRDAYAPLAVLWAEANLSTEWQAWAPTMDRWSHVPARFGVLEFVRP